MQMFGVGSAATWQKWVDQGLPRVPRGRGYSYDADEIRAWLEANPQPGHGGDREDLDLDAGEAQDLYRRERALKTAAERELRELNLARERGELVRAADVHAEWTRAALAIRARFAELGATLAAPLAEATTEQEAEEIVDGAIRAALDELAALE